MLFKMSLNIARDNFGPDFRAKLLQSPLYMAGLKAKFLNSLRGEIVSIFPNVKPTFQGMGATAKVDFLFIVEKMR